MLRTRREKRGLACSKTWQLSEGDFVWWARMLKLFPPPTVPHKSPRLQIPNGMLWREEVVLRPWAKLEPQNHCYSSISPPILGASKGCPCKVGQKPTAPDGASISNTWSLLFFPSSLWGRAQVVRAPLNCRAWGSCHVAHWLRSLVPTSWFRALIWYV